MQTFCTIITADHFPFAKVLYTSLNRQVPGTMLHMLVVDKNQFQPEGDLKVLQIEDFSGSDSFKEAERKYAHTNSDHFRWALKPLLIAYLLQKGFSKVIFADPDLYFTGKFDFMWKLLDEHSMVLSPHWPDPDMINNPDSVLSVMKGGLYNAGFIGANQNALAAINWWAAMCNYKMDKNAELGIFVDQKYLDLLPVQFEGIYILKHRGCNLAGWNIQSNKRELVDGHLMINKKYEPVFIHFARDTVTNILNRNDALLKPLLDEYIAALNNNGFDLMKNIDQLHPGQYDAAIYKLKHKTRLRTRLKRFFYKLAEKL